MYVKASHYERRKTCSRECDRKRRQTIYSGKNNPNFGNKGPKNPLFKTGTKISRYGYRLLYKPEHPNAQKDGYILEHRFVLAEHLGRPLLDCECVHHKDENKLNNSIDNLEILSKSEHTKLHCQGKTLLRDGETGRILGVVPKEENKWRKPK
ncbi:HNH endonuclease [Bacillus haynesii]|uniref:HNH endonuclease n=1 Tax=Bacillus haynesii TaxID=1925021 RepID=UPI003990A1DC